MVEFRKPDERPAEPSSAESPARTVADEIREIVAAVRNLISAEAAYQAARARLMGKALAWCAGAGTLALALLFFVLMAVIVGALLALEPVLGAWGALGAVVGGLLVFTLISGLVCWLALRRFLALLRDGKERP